MPIIKSISGIRGTIGNKTGENLTPADVEKFSAAFGSLLLEGHSNKKDHPVMVIGRDGRVSGESIRNIVTKTITGLGIDVIDLGLSTTPTVEIAVKKENAMGGIII